MRIRILLALGVAAFVLGECKRKAAPNLGELGDADGSIAEPHIGDPDAQPRVTFTIDAIYNGSRPTKAPPWHEPGGDWTFFDAHIEGGARFGFGFHSGSAAEGLSFGKGMITVPTAADGAKIVERFATTFNGKAPPVASPQPLRFTPFSTTVLGQGQARRQGGGFAGVGGWTATKLFLQRPGLEAEVFFNYDLGAKRGEFAEKDRDYADDMVAFLARELRDGPRPPRTPENDPQVSAIGPKFDAWRSFGPAKASAIRFEANGKRILYSVADGSATKLVSAALDNPTDEVLVLRVENQLGVARCAALSDDPCVVEESMPKTAGVLSIDDPRVFHLVERAKKTTRVLEGPGVDKGTLAMSAPISPDGAFVTMHEWRPKSSGRGPFAVLNFVPIAGGAPRSVNLGEESVDLVAWTGKGAALRAVVKRGDSWRKDAKLSWSVVDPKTGTAIETPTAPAGSVVDLALSPDGRRRVSCDGDQDVVVTDLATTAARRFHIFDEDRHAFKNGDCLDWASGRFLHYFAGRVALLDTDTMKLSYPFDEGAEPPALEYDRAFTAAVSTSPEGIRVARIVVK